MEIQNVNQIRELADDELDAVTGGVVPAAAVAGAIAIGAGAAVAVVGAGALVGYGLWWLTK
jgi:lactobin A/cerein 7B family class IIb bacteriocin